MWKIGNIEVQGRVVLAPMAGVTSEGYRKYMNSFGCDLCFTEMVSDMGLIYDNEETIDYIRYQNDVCPTGVQLFGNNPANLAKAALKCLSIKPDIEFFDINMGCPVNKVVKPGSGSFLMTNPKLAGDIIRAVKEATGLPCTAKIRLGFNEVNFMDVISELEEAGVDTISIHARTRKDLYYGEPKWEYLKDLQSKMKVPLIVSGNIFSVEEAVNAIKLTGAQAVMVARGGMGNPLLVRDIQNALNGNEVKSDYTFDSQKKMCIELAQSLINEKGELLGMRIYRSIAPKFFSGFKNSKALRVKLASQVTTYQSMLDILEEFKTNNIQDF